MLLFLAKELKSADKTHKDFKAETFLIRVLFVFLNGKSFQELSPYLRNLLSIRGLRSQKSFANTAPKEDPFCFTVMTNSFLTNMTNSLKSFSRT